MKKTSKLLRTADFLFEIGTMRKLMRIHRQLLLTDDLSDSISSHSFRVALIGWILAKMTGADPYTVVMMCLCHDMAEVRANDHNWLHRRYVTVHEDEINQEQLGELPFMELFEMISAYEKRESFEAVVAKDADTLDQIMLLREYEWQGNKEARIWLHGKSRKRKYAYVDRLKTEKAKELGRALYDREPSAWWRFLYTAEPRRKD